MKIGTIEKIFDFLKANEGKELPREWVRLIKKTKLIKELENHPDGEQYRYEGDLNLNFSKITKLPNNLYVGRSLFIDKTPLAKKYTNEQIREIVTSTGGQIIGKIRRNL